MSQPLDHILIHAGAAVVGFRPPKWISPALITIDRRSRTISSVSRTHDLPAEGLSSRTGYELHNVPDGIVLPGLLNGHCHLSMSPLRTLGSDLRLDDWLHKVMIPMESQVITPEYTYLAALTSGIELLRSGCTHVCDMNYCSVEAARALVDLGMRGTLSEAIVGDLDSRSEGRIRDLFDYCIGQRLLQASCAVHSAHTCSLASMSWAHHEAERRDTFVHMHIAESQEEGLLCRGVHGVDRLDVLRRTGLLNTPLLLAHGVHLDEPEVDALAASQNACVVHCPTSNAYLSVGLCAVGRLLASGIPMVLGTDGAASAGRLDLLEEARAVIMLQRGRTDRSVPLRTWDAVALASGVGLPRAFVPYSGLGCLAPGGAADLVVYCPTVGVAQPIDPVIELVMNPANWRVEHTMIDGEWVLFRGEPLRVSRSDAADRFRDLVTGVRAIACKLGLSRPWAQLDR